MNHSTTLSTITRVAVGGALALSLALGLTALGAGTALAAKKSGSSTTQRTASNAFKAYTTCLAKHGVKLPKRTQIRRSGSGGTRPNFAGGPPPGAGFFGGARRINNPKYARAAAACKSKLPKGGFGGFGGGRPFTPTPAQQAALTKFEQCMASHGVRISSTATFATIRSLMQADPSAANACRSDLSGIFGRPPGAPPATGAPTSTS